MSGTIQKAASIVSTKWLAERLAVRTSNLAVLDGSWHMPFEKRDPYAEFKLKHIPRAHFFGIDECRDKSNPHDHMIPKAEDFSSYVGNLGIDNDTHIIVYDNNDKFGLFSAQRVWWTFRLFGHNLVSVLDGGLNKWIHDGYATTEEIETVVPTKFHVRYRGNLFKSFEDIQQNFSANNFLVVDARAAGRFNGTAPEPREGIPPGHMPGSINIPFRDMLNPETNTMKSPEELQKVFDTARIDLSKPLVGTCGTGISACLLALGAYQLGKEDFAVYDGSWTEYAQRCQPEQILKNT